MQDVHVGVPGLEDALEVADALVARVGGGQRVAEILPPLLAQIFFEHLVDFQAVGVVALQQSDAAVRGNGYGRVVTAA
ncbi:hypothetical protein ACFOY2_45255 [Nonomuraea purpurea]|uniref:Uncharacterized protein n=1 Tax=Nonomuraea purpurea TaxID=1849276 RepID=A0ABV8GNL4_9ACTN